jgi:hypothetical protein
MLSWTYLGGVGILVHLVVTFGGESCGSFHVQPERSHVTTASSEIESAH